MRHLLGLIGAIALAAAVFFAASWGYLRLLRIPVANGGAATLPAQGGGLLHSTSVLEAFAAVAGTGLLAGIFIAVRRISPLAAGLPGLALIAWTVVYGFSVRRAVHYIPLRGDTYGTGFEAMLMNGVLAAAGLALVVPLFIPSRWRGRPGPDDRRRGHERDPGPRAAVAFVHQRGLDPDHRLPAQRPRPVANQKGAGHPASLVGGRML